VSAANGRIIGMGAVDGRRVAIEAQDNTELGGSGDLYAHHKVAQLVRMANERGYPIVRLMDGIGGARLPEQMGSRGMVHDKNIGGGMPDDMFQVTRQTPRVTAILGECFGEPSWNASQSDFVVMVKGGAMGAAGPRIIREAIGENITPQELAGWEIHAKYTGQIGAFAEDEAEAFRIIKKFLSFMPSHNGEEAPFLDSGDPPLRKLEKVDKIITDQLNRGYDMHRFIKMLVDNGDYLSIKDYWGRGVTTCLGRIGGMAVGIIANNPLYNAGAPDVAATEKEVHFLCLCDSFNIPIVWLADVPGMFPGTDSEKLKLPTKITTLLQAIGLVTVPKVGVLLRKAYGIGWRCMGISQDDMYAAWPIASISFVDPATGIELVYGRKMANTPDRAGEKARLLKEWSVDSAPWGAAATKPLEVIDPADTRKWIYEALIILRGNRKNFIGKHQLATWPGGF
ncbi:MAG: carboxyl transferase domain-containing protein, partial [Dehalococcoidales bacterium]|nr:carboxyl transferase domain-containing protein [Dehalococcoidales bacterium]